MKNNIIEFVNLIKEKTGITLSIYDDNGFAVIKDDRSPETISVPVEEVKILDDEGYTLFPVKICQKSCVALIEGVEGFNLKFALLIKELADGFNNKDSVLSKNEFYSSLILGELSSGRAQKYVKKFCIPQKKCFVIIVSSIEGKTQDVISVLKYYVNERDDFVFAQDEDTCIIIKFCDNQQSEYKSSTEYADYLLKSVYEECGLLATAFVGGVVNTPLELSESYSQADQALKSARLLGVKGDAHTFKEYLLVKMIRELPKYKISEYLELLSDEDVKSIFSDSEIIATAEEFLENNLNVSETARKLFIHRNTLIYRIDKIEKSTGLNIRNFADALTFRLMTILLKVSL